MRLRGVEHPRRLSPALRSGVQLGLDSLGERIAQGRRGDS
jgi:hypothetical protein